MKRRSSLLISSVLGAALFIVGYFIVVFVPGGGTVTEQEFLTFYGSDQGFNTLMLLVALLIGCWAITWFFTELRFRLPEDVLSSAAYATGVVGLLTVAVGGAILFAPTGVQMNSDLGFVGVPIAHAFAQAGITTMLLIGMYTIGLSVALFSVALRRAGQVPSWLSIAGIVVAVLMLGSFVWAPGLLFPIWVLAIGAMGRKQEATAVSPSVAPA